MQNMLSRPETRHDVANQGDVEMERKNIDVLQPPCQVLYCTACMIHAKTPIMPRVCTKLTFVDVSVSRVPAMLLS